MGKINSRDKGARYERELAKYFREHGFPESRRGVQYHGGPDSPDVVGLPGIHIEAKHVEKLNLDAAMQQSIRDSCSDEMSVVIHKKNRRASYVTMTLRDWTEMYTCYYNNHPRTGHIWKGVPKTYKED